MKKSPNGGSSSQLISPRSERDLAQLITKVQKTPILTIDIPDSVAEQLQSYSPTERHRFAAAALSLGAALAYRPLTPVEALALPADLCRRILQAQAETMAPYYEADLARPPAERELTAFTALDGVDPILEPERYSSGE